MDATDHAAVNTAIYQFAERYLEKRGWFQSLMGVPHNHDGVVPWITYPAFLQLKRIIRRDFKVFEYGCGSSSIWWANHVAEVTSVEHNPEWADHITASAPRNLKVVSRPRGEAVDAKRRKAVAPFFAGDPELPLSQSEDHNVTHGLLCDDYIAYATEITTFPKAYFDVIVVDGSARSLCAWLAPKYLKPGGIVVFDNSDRWQYNAGYRALHAAGLRRIDYYGPGPVNRHEWCTSLWVRDPEVFSQSIDSPQGDCDLRW